MTMPDAPTALVTKPGIDETENEFRVRLRNPGDFQDDSFRTITIKRDKPKIFGVVGRLKDETSTTLQALRFPKDEGWTKERVKEWLSAHPDVGKSLDEQDAESDEIDDADIQPGPMLTAATEALRTVLEKEPDPSQTMYKHYRPSVVKAADTTSFEVEAIISTRSIDRDREVVLPEGMKIRGAKRVPLVASHDYRELRKQIGEVLRVKPDGDGVNARMRYLAGRGNPEADWGWVLVEEGLAAYSIGFMPTKWDDADLNDEKVVQAILAGKKPLRTYTEWELVEVSHVAVPSNRDAVQHAVSKGLYSPQEGENILALMEQVETKAEPEVEVKAEEPKTKAEVLAELDTYITNAPTGEVRMVQVGAETEEEKDVLALLEVKASWSVGGSRGLPLSDDSSWDASAARASLGDDMGVWKRAHIVYDSDAPDQKGSYKLPFARREGGSLKASKSGLQAARQRLSATDVPDSVRAAAGRFIDSYLGKQEERAPSLRFVSDAPDGERRIEIRDEDDKIVFAGTTKDLCDTVLRSVGPQQVEVKIAPVSIEPNGLKPVLDAWKADFIAQLKAALDAHAKTLPTFPADSAAFTAIGDLTEAVIAVAEKIARREATAAVEKAQGNVDHYRR